MSIFLIVEDRPAVYRFQPQHCVLLAVCLLMTTGCGRQQDSTSIAATRNAIDAVMRQTLESDEAIQSVLFGVGSPSRAFTHHSAFGLSRHGSTAAVSTSSQFMIASITKTLVATRILQLSEAGVLGLDDRLGDLGVFPEEVIIRLHSIDGTSYGDRITVRQLLNHTSGLRDYLLDDRNAIGKNVEGGVAAGSLAGVWLSHLDAFLSGTAHPGCADLSDCDLQLYPARQWPHWDADAFAADPANRNAGLLNFYLAEMADAAAFPPGEGAHYSDTNYLLLGLVIESLTGDSLEGQLQKGIFAPLGMRDTYMSYSATQEHPTDRVTDWYAFDVPMVSVGADTSWDWGGGGIVTTTADLLTFVHALMHGKLFTQTGTLEEMLRPVRLLEEGGTLLRGYGLGIAFSRTNLGPRWGHSGAWGAHMYYFPDIDVAVAGTLNDYGSVEAGERAAMEIAAAVAGL
jgi:D-alanyl-D-alanine carboxypeptidase